MRFTVYTSAALCVVFSLTSAARGQVDNERRTLVTSFKPLPTGKCPPLNCKPITRRTCVQGRCIEERSACYGGDIDIMCPD
ncbi:hypothetical protein K438DRAFT_1984092 [Mycena galopus ATCC 62051]|nr:hypothetical protein K438DRAFT_1984092 [Mycena galopus ATCC 62051]